MRSLLDESHIDQLTEADYREIVALLWAYIGWRNKDYIADLALKNTDFNVKTELKNLLYGDAPLKHYDRFFEKVRGMGPAGITEILAFIYPDQCGIWNDKSRIVLETLGLGQELPTRKYRISGSEYEKFCNALKSIGSVLKLGEKFDLLFVDLFIYHTATSVAEHAPPPEDEDYDFDHDEVV